MQINNIEQIKIHMTERYRIIVENLGEGVVVMDFKEEFLLANPAACKIFEVQKEKLIGRNFKDFTDDKEWKRILDQNKFRKEGKTSTYELKISTEKKNKKTLLVTGTPEYDQNGTVINTIGVFRDITERADEKDKLNEFNQQLEELHQQLFTQTIEADMRKDEVEKYSKEIEKHKEKVDIAYKQLNDGINYAKTIQNSLLPSFSDMKNILPENHFVLSQPKQSIGGDFFYAKERDDYIIFAVADCTGHGVSGALITMLGISFLNDIIDRNLLVNSVEILNKLREKIKHAFHAYRNNVENKNGMDIALCIVNKKTNLMQFSGAFNPLYIIRNNKLSEYKSTRNPIGYYPVEKEFEAHHIQLQENDNIYLFSDGFFDQTGGAQGLKYSKKRFKELLLKIHKEEAVIQKEKLEKELVNWKAKHRQVDDITIMGVKWNK